MSARGSPDSISGYEHRLGRGLFAMCNHDWKVSRSICSDTIWLRSQGNRRSQQMNIGARSWLEIDLGNISWDSPLFLTSRVVLENEVLVISRAHQPKLHPTPHLSPYATNQLEMLGSLSWPWMLCCDKVNEEKSTQVWWWTRDLVLDMRHPIFCLIIHAVIQSITFAY